LIERVLVSRVGYINGCHSVDAVQMLKNSVSCTILQLK